MLGTATGDPRNLTINTSMIIKRIRASSTQAMPISNRCFVMQLFYTKSVTELCHNTNMSKKKVLTGLLIAVIAFVAWMFHILSTPSEGTISTPASASKSQPEKKDMFKKLDSQYFQMEYPDYFTSHKTDPPRSPYLETYDFTATYKGIWELAVQLESLPSGNLSEETAFRFRDVHPERFTKTNSSVNGAQVAVFEDMNAEQGFSRSAFFLHDGKVALVTLSGQKSPEIEAVYTRLLQSFTWK
jgi:hypothetical protein